MPTKKMAINKKNKSKFNLKKLALAVGLAFATVIAAPISTTLLSTPAAAERAQTFSADELVDAGHGFFGQTSSGLATLVEKAVSSYGLPNGYILGEEGSGALVAGLRYGEGKLFTKNAGDHPVFWQGPSIGWDFGGDGNRTMMLVYNLTSINKLYRRFVGVSGSAYLVGGLGMTVLKRGSTILIPVRTGVGARLGVNIGYLKLRDRPTWNPF